MKLKPAMCSIFFLTLSTVLFQNCGGHKSYTPSNERTQAEELSNDDVDAKLDEAESACNSAFLNRFTAVTLAENSSISGLKAGLYKVDHLSGISGLGSVVVISGSGSASVDVISHFTGSVVLCGLDVDSVSNSNGNLYVVDGNVGDVDGYIGNIVIRRGTLTGEVTNSAMNLLQLSADNKYSGQVFNQLF